MKKQILIFLIGFISLIIAIGGYVVVFNVFDAADTFSVGSAVVLFIIWSLIVILWLKNKMPEKLYKRWIENNNHQ